MGISLIARRIDFTELSSFLNRKSDRFFETLMNVGYTSLSRNFKNYNFSLKNRIFRPSFSNLLTHNEMLKVRFYIVTP